MSRVKAASSPASPPLTSGSVGVMVEKRRYRSDRYRLIPVSAVYTRGERLHKIRDRPLIFNHFWRRAPSHRSCQRRARRSEAAECSALSSPLQPSALRQAFGTAKISFPPRLCLVRPRPALSLARGYALCGAPRAVIPYLLRDRTFLAL